LYFLLGSLVQAASRITVGDVRGNIKLRRAQASFQIGREAGGESMIYVVRYRQQWDPSGSSEVECCMSVRSYADKSGGARDAVTYLSHR
jgi:hypothetical protein